MLWLVAQEDHYLASSGEALLGLCERVPDAFWKKCVRLCARGLAVERSSAATSERHWWDSNPLRHPLDEMGSRRLRRLRSGVEARHGLCM